MCKLAKVLPVGFCVVAMSAVALGQTSGDYRSATTGNWNSIATWQKHNGSTWGAASLPPTNLDGAITVLHTVHVSVDVTADQLSVQDNGNLIIEDAKTLTIAAGAGDDFTVSNIVENLGTVTMNSSATIILNGGSEFIHATTTSSSGIVAAMTADPTSTWRYRGSLTLPHDVTISGATYGNLTFESTSGIMSVSVSGSGTLVATFLSVEGSGSTNVDFTGYTGDMNVAAVVINAGNSLTVGSSMLTVTQDWTNSGAFNAGSGKVVFHSLLGFDHFMGQYGTGAFHDLEINSSNNVIVDTDITVNGTLILTSGSFILGSSIMTLGPSAAIGGTPGSTRMVITDGTGSMRKVFTGTGSFTFPVGENTGTTEYSPVTLSFSSGTFSSAYAGVRVIDAKHSSNTSATDFLSRYWTVTQSGISGFSCTVTCTYLPADVNGTESSIYGGKWNGSSWTGLNQVNTSTKEFTGTVSSFGDFTGAELAILPVQLVSFTAKASQQNAELHWSTATETNNYGFEVERRLAGSNNWAKVGFVAGAGTSTSPRQYSFVDANVSAGRYAYRLKQVDNDGTFSNSGSAEVEIGLAAKEFKLESNYPNPFNPSTTIQFTLAEDGKASLKVFTMLGQEVATLFDGEAQAGRVQQVKFDASKLPSGLYFAKLEAGKQ